LELLPPSSGRKSLPCKAADLGSSILDCSNASEWKQAFEPLQVSKLTEEAAREHSACGLPYYSTILFIHDNESMLEAYSKKQLTRVEFYMNIFAKCHTLSCLCIKM
jgi:hypothetical protein